MDWKEKEQIYLDKLNEQLREISRLRGALEELVALKDMKDRGFGSHDTDGEDEYMRRKPIAWHAARNALMPNGELTRLDAAGGQSGEPKANES